MTVTSAAQALAGANDYSPWTNFPDMTVIRGGRREPVAMPPELFGPAWPLLKAVAEGTATAPDYPAIAFLAACASLIGGKRRAKPYEGANWTEPCILWCAAVGDPSTRKSPALEEVTAPLREIERDQAEAHKHTLHQWQSDSGIAKAVREEWQAGVKKAIKDGTDPPAMPEAADEPDEPCRRRPLVVDATPEAVGAILAGNPQGTMHFRDELAGWLMSFDRYSPGGREFWLEAYGGRPFSIDRKGNRAPIVIAFNGVSVLGGIQPAKLASVLLDNPDDGLVARFLWSWPDKVPFRRPSAPADMDVLRRAYRRLEDLHWGTDHEGRNCPVTIPLSAVAADAFEEWQKANSEADEDAGSLFKSFVGKMDGAVLRLALVGEYIRWAFAADGKQPPASVSWESLGAAAEFVDDYAKPMAMRVYGDAALPKAERDAAILARHILKTGQRRFNARAMRRAAGYPGPKAAEPMNEALRHLVESDWIMAAPSRAGDLPGRQSADYIVNPGVFENG